MVAGERVTTASGDGRLQHGIAMWGVPSSGKTTFLAALSLALNQQEDDWNVIGVDTVSEKKLMELTTSLTKDRMFPPPTRGIDSYGWILNGLVSHTERNGMKRRRQREVPVKISLDLVDASGEIGNPEQATFSLREELVENLARCRGIVFMFDPVREFNEGDAFDNTFGMLVQLAGKLQVAKNSNGRLPHHVAVCVTKFDEQRVIETANRLDMLEADPADRYEFPRVNDDDARDFFIKLCSVSGTGNGEMIPNTLERYFRRDRVKYFITSAVGFYVDPMTGKYDPDDPMNLLPANPPAQPFPRIRGPIHPINVVEPLLWLGRKVAAAKA